MDGLLTTFKLCIILVLFPSCNSGKGSKASAFLLENNRDYDIRWLQSQSSPGRVKEALEILNLYQKVSPKGKTLEQKAVLLEMRKSK